ASRRSTPPAARSTTPTPTAPCSRPSPGGSPGTPGCGSRRGTSTSTTPRSRPRPRETCSACSAGFLPPDAAMCQMSRSEILETFRRKVAQGVPIIGGGAGTGLSAKCAEAGGIDLIIIYNSGRFRMAGRGSLAGLMPYGDAHAVVMDIAREVLPGVERTPVLAGVCATDPFRVMRRFLAEVRDAGFAGVQNFPTVGLIDGAFRQGLEETGMGYAKEVDMIALAREMDLLTCPYVHNESEA